MAAALDQHLHAFLLQVHPYMVAGSQRLISLFPECVKGITLTCAGFYGPQGRQLRAQPLHPGLAQSVSQFAFEDHRITNFEMETAAIYGLGKILNHDCCSISAIVANRINQTYCEDGEAAVDGMIRYALGKIATL